MLTHDLALGVRLEDRASGVVEHRTRDVLSGGVRVSHATSQVESRVGHAPIRAREGLNQERIHDRDRPCVGATGGSCTRIDPVKEVLLVRRRMP